MPRLIALDVGEVRIGVALSDATGLLASPYTTLHVTKDASALWTALQQVIEQTEADGVIIGLPVSLDGAIHAQARRILAFGQRLKMHTSLPITFWDERLSTVEAERLLAERGQNLRERRQIKATQKNGQRQQAGGHKRKRRNPQEIDALAATVILQGYLDSQPRERITHSDQMGDNDS